MNEHVDLRSQKERLLFELYKARISTGTSRETALTKAKDDLAWFKMIWDKEDVYG